MSNARCPFERQSLLQIIVATGDKTTTSDAGGNSFVVPEPTDKTVPDYAKNKQAFDEFQVQAAREPLAVKLADNVGHLRIATNFSWTLITGYLVLFMQAGFALLTCGLMRKKNAGHLMMLNFAAYVFAFLAYYVCGYAFQYGGAAINAAPTNLGGTPTLDRFLIGHGLWDFLGGKGFFLSGPAYDAGSLCLTLFEVVYMETAGYIIVGAICERITFGAFLLCEIFIGAVLYPIFGCWVWGGGWLSQLGTTMNLGHGYVDFAGSTVVHGIGGFCAMALAIILGPRLGKYGPDGKPRAFPAHNLVFVVVGTFILLFGWMGFNPGSTLGASDLRIFRHRVGLEPQGTIPHLLYMCYQDTFAIITAALISGAIVERMRFSAYVVFITLWSLVVSCPIAHWVWGGGWLAQIGALDFAGGTVVHVNAGVAALVAAMVVGPRRDYPSSSVLPHNIPFTLLGAGLLWFGWFGFNIGSAVAANGIAALAFTATMLAPAATLVVWMLLDVARSRNPTAVGAATAIVVGLVAITPAAGFVGPMSALILGGLAAIPSYFALLYRARTALDDSLDVVAAHGLGGTVGALLTGVFAQKALNGVANGLAFGNPAQFGIQAVAVVAAIAYSAIGSFMLLKLIGLFIPLRAGRDDESMGLDLSQHGEEAYVHSEGAAPAYRTVSAT